MNKEFPLEYTRRKGIVFIENIACIYKNVDRYYEPGERETLFLGKKVRKQHHTLTQVLNGLLESGFAIEHVEESMPSPEMMGIPEMKDEMRRPMMLLVKARKTLNSL